jgi:GT2 family glycosyltransferase
MEISIIVLTYNAKDITIKMLTSLRKSINFFEEETGKKTEVLVIDNASTDGVLDEVKKFDFVKIVPNTENLGFAKGNNKAFRETNPEAKYVLFLNPDIILEESTIYDTYVFYKSQDNAGLVTCDIFLPNGQRDIDCHRAFPTIWNSICYFTKLEKLLGTTFPSIFGGYHILSADFTKSHEIDACLGAFMFIERSVFERVGGWSEDYFLNGEDIDLCYKIKVLEGKKILFFVGTSVVHHKGSSKGTKKITSSKVKVSSKTKELQIKSGIEAMKIFYKKFYAPKSNFLVNWMVYLGIDTLKFIRLITKSE